MQNRKAASNEKRSAETKEKIVKSAELLFRERGFENTSINSIVQKAGISKGAFYVHFNSKDAIVADFINVVISEMNLDYEIIINSVDDDGPVSAALVLLLEKIARTIADDLGYVLVKNVALIQINKALNYDLLMCYNRNLYVAVYRLFNFGIERGEFKTNESADALANDFVTTIRGFIFEWCAIYPDMDLKKRLQEHYKTYVAGLTCSR